MTISVFPAGYSGNVKSYHNDYTVCHDAEEGSSLGSNLIIGQRISATFEIFRGFVFFDTSALPVDCLISNVTLTLKYNNDYWSQKDFYIIIQKGSGGAPHNPLVVADYLYSQYSDNGGQALARGVDLEFTLNSSGIGWINKAGWTKLALISKDDIDYIEPTQLSESEGFYGYDDVNKPLLTVEYFAATGVPTVGDPTFSNLRKTSLLATANVTDDGGLYSERGFEYGLTETATWTEKETGSFTGTGNFSLTVSDNISLPGTYYVRAYVKNSYGTGYSNWIKLEVESFINYGEWVKFVTAAPGEPGDKPLGYKNDVCSDNSGYTYILNRSLLDDGATYKSHFVLSTDLSGKKTLHTNKRLLDMFSYFANKGTGTAKVYVKRDTEPEWQEAGEISLTGKEEIVIQHIPVDYLAKTYLIKFTFENDFEFIGSIFESIPIGDR